MYNSMYDPENDTCDNISRRSETAQVVTDQGSNKRYPVSIWKYDDEGKLVKVRQISGRISGIMLCQLSKLLTFNTIFVILIIEVT